MGHVTKRVRHRVSGPKKIKGWVIGDKFIDAPLVDEYLLVDEFPNEEVLTVVEIDTWMLYFDESYMHNGVGVGGLFITPQGYYIPNSFKLAFPHTNNIV